MTSKDHTTGSAAAVRAVGSNLSDYQREIYVQGMFADRRSTVTTNLAELENQAARVLTPDAMSYVVASAGSGETAAANRRAFDQWQIAPRMLNSAADRDHSCTILGTRMPAPLLVAPLGVQVLAHPEAELATARAAAELGITYVHSTQASRSIEEVAEANGGGARWFQLYRLTDDEVCKSFLRRAAACGYTTLVVTLDTSMPAWPTGALRLGPRRAGRGYARPALDPRGVRPDDRSVRPPCLPRPVPRLRGSTMT